MYNQRYVLSTGEVVTLRDLQEREDYDTWYSTLPINDQQRIDDIWLEAAYDMCCEYDGNDWQGE